MCFAPSLALRWSHYHISGKALDAMTSSCNFSQTGPIRAAGKAHAALRDGLSGAAAAAAPTQLQADCEAACDEAMAEMGPLNIYQLFADVCPGTGLARSDATQLARKLAETMPSVGRSAVDTPLAAAAPRPSLAARLLERARQVTALFSRAAPGGATDASPSSSDASASAAFGDSSDGSGFPAEAPCIDDFVTAYLNRADVRAAMHVREDAPVWSVCTDAINYSMDDLLSSMLPIYPKLIDAGLRVWVYSGDVDGIVPTSGSRAWVEGLGLKELQAWRPWTASAGRMGPQVGGYVVEYEGLTFATVRCACCAKRASACSARQRPPRVQHAAARCRRYVFCFVASTLLCRLLADALRHAGARRWTHGSIHATAARGAPVQSLHRGHAAVSEAAKDAPLRCAGASRRALDTRYTLFSCNCSACCTCVCVECAWRRQVMRSGEGEARSEARKAWRVTPHAARASSVGGAIRHNTLCTYTAGRCQLLYSGSFVCYSHRRARRCRSPTPHARAQPRRLERRQAMGSLKRSYSGSRRSWRLRLDMRLGSALLKKRGASSTSHLGSMAHTSRMYSLVVRMSSKYTTQSGWRWNSADEGWMYTGVFSTVVRYPSCGSLRAAWKKKPLVMARRMELKLRPAETTSSL
jgi:hypothetical protein